MIQEGLLWFDDSPNRALTDKIERAVHRYQQKFGHNPDVCYVHPAHLREGELSLAKGVQVLPAKSVLPHHFWLGTRQAQTRASRSRSQRRP